MKTICAIVFSLAIHLPVISAQATCTEDQFWSFVQSIPNGELCRLAYLGVLYPQNLTDSDYAAALSAYCTEDCAGQIAQYARTDCGLPEYSTILSLYCLHNGDEYCRSMFPDFLKKSFISDLAQCLEFDAECPAGCEAALSRGVSKLGCCYQEIYNSTEMVAYLNQIGRMTDQEVSVMSAVAVPEIWSACNVSSTSLCAEPFQQEKEVLAGICSELDFYPLVTRVSMECITALSTIFTSPTVESVETYCDDSCTGQYVSFLRENCQAHVLANLSEAACLRTEGEIGDRCGLIKEEAVTSLFTNVGSACGTADLTQDCPTACRDTLQELADQLGCCYQNIYNNTMFLDYLVTFQELSAEERALLEAVKNPVGWNTCSVPLPPRCGAEAGAIQLASSTVLMLCAVFTALF